MKRNISHGQLYFYSGLTILGELLKVSNMLKLTNYNFFQGHLSDFSLSALWTNALLSNYDNTKLGRLVSVLAPPTALTIWEFMQPVIAPKVSHTDPIDIGCYFSGSILAYFGAEFFGIEEKRRKITNFVKKVNPIKSKAIPHRSLDCIAKCVDKDIF